MKPEKAKAKILELSGMTEEEYFFLQVDCAMAYLRDVIQADEMGVNAISESKLFWSWWINQWERRDSIMLRNMNFSKDRFPTYTNWIPNEKGDAVCEFVVFDEASVFLEFYKKKNNPEFLDIYPNRKIMHESYFKMAHKMIKEAVKQPIKYTF